MLFIGCVETASRLYSFPASDVVNAIFDAYSPHISFLYDDEIFLSRSVYLLVELNEVTNLKGNYNKVTCEYCIISSVIEISDYLYSSSSSLSFIAIWLQLPFSSRFLKEN